MIITLDVDAAAPGRPLHHFWSTVVGAGRANEGLRADWQAQLRDVVQHVGFRYVRFHGLFHDDMFVYREVDGDVRPNFHYVDVLFDALLEIGIRPFVELGFSPAELARRTATVFWWRGNGSPPTDLAKWSALMDATIRHWIERYGIDEVRSWYFEVWNEPNLAPFFEGTRSEYFELYAATATTIKAIDGGLRVGGPSTSNFVPDARFDGEVEDTSEHALVLSVDDLGSLEWKPVWLDAFLQFCDARGLPVDFVSCHPYPTDWALDEHGQGAKLTRPVDATPLDLHALRRIVDASAFPHAEIHLTEWSSSSSSRDYTHDYPQAATFVVKANLESIGTVDSLAYWTFTDIFEEQGAGQEPLHGGFGLLTQNGWRKPTFHAYRLLATLGTTLLAQQPGVVASATPGGGFSAVGYHYPEEVTLSVPASFDDRDVADAVLGTGGDTMVDLRVAGLAPGERLIWEVVDAAHGNLVAAWRGEGSPDNPTRAQAERVRAAGEATLREELTADGDGVIHLVRPVAAWSVFALRSVSPELPRTRE